MNKEDIKTQNFIKKLENDGHTCIKLIETEPVFVEWCQQEICLGHDYKEKAAEKQKKESDDLLQKIKNEGHMCIKYRSNSYSWCKQSECIETRKLFEKLKNNDHNCIKDETFMLNPIWCNQPVCIGLPKFSS